MDPKLRHDIALWRYELIQDALDPSLSRRERSRRLRAIARTPVKWPSRSGPVRCIALATLYRWSAAFQHGGLEALRPRPRRDRGRVRRPLPPAVIDEAIRLLSEPLRDGQAPITLTFLIAAVEAVFNSGRSPADRIRIARSTLARRLAADPRYRTLRRARTKRRTRFVARAPHEIWQLDAKGPVTLRLASGEAIAFHVLTVLDDATRAVLAALVALHPDLAAAVAVFRRAVLRWGLPGSLYADRASIFDAKAFRAGLAQLGTYRIPTRPRNAAARGKVEAYHRVLVLWFTDRLPAQTVVDVEHLQHLLDGMIASLYQTHRHRGLRQAPEHALAGRCSTRQLPPARLYEAFRQRVVKRAHPVTGEVELGAHTFLVPDDLRGRRLTFLVDPPGEVPPVVLHPEREDDPGLPLERARIRPDDRPDADAAPPAPVRWGAGPLQAIYDAWAGARRPVAEPGFGLPELYALLAGAAGRHVPATDPEAALVQRVYAALGPWTRAATEAAVHAIALELGPRRPLSLYLDALAARVRRTGSSDVTDR